MHVGCLAQWQAQLQAQKGAAAASSCDVCRTRWSREYGLLGAQHRGRWGNVAGAARALQPWAATLVWWWKAAVVAQGALQALEAGAQGFRLGLRYRGTALRANADQRAIANVVGWVPLSILAAGVVPPVQLPVFFAM